jgi:hypothetical protein
VGVLTIQPWRFYIVVGVFTFLLGAIYILWAFNFTVGILTIHPWRFYIAVGVFTFLLGVFTLCGRLISQWAF